MPLFLNNDRQQELLDWSLILTPNVMGVRIGQWPVGYSSALGVYHTDDPDTPRAVLVTVQTHPGIVEAHFSSDRTKTWATKNIMRGIFGFIFLVKKAYRCQAVIHTENASMTKFALMCGFKPEGIMRGLGGPGHDGLMLSMLPDDCNYLDPQDKEALRYVQQPQST